MYKYWLPSSQVWGRLFYVQCPALGWARPAGSRLETGRDEIRTLRSELRCLLGRSVLCLSRDLSRHVTTLCAKYLQTSQLRDTMRTDVTLFVTIKSVNILLCVIKSQAVSSSYRVKTLSDSSSNVANASIQSFRTISRLRPLLTSSSQGPKSKPKFK